MKYLLEILMLIIAILGTIKDYLFNNISKRNSIILSAILITFLILITYLQIRKIKKVELNDVYSSQTGKIQSPKKSNETQALFNLNGALLDVKFVFGDDTEITAEMRNNRAEITTHIRDSSGNLIGEIKNNNWWIIPNPSLYSDRNFNKNTLEILNPKGDPIFQVRILGNQIFIAGYFFDKNGLHAVTLLPWIHEIDNLDKRLFKYPSLKYPGIINDIKK